MLVDVTPGCELLLLLDEPQPTTTADSAAATAPMSSDLERARRGELRDHRKHATREPCAGGADYECERLRARHMQATKRRRNLVIANSPQPAPRPAVQQVVEHEHHQ